MGAVCSPLGLLFPTPLCFCAGCAAGWGRRAEPGLRSQLRTSCCSAGCRRTCSNGTALSPHTANHSKERKVNFPFFFFPFSWSIHFPIRGRGCAQLTGCAQGLCHAGGTLLCCVQAGLALPLFLPALRFLILLETPRPFGAGPESTLRVEPYLIVQCM